MVLAVAIFGTTAYAQTDGAMMKQVPTAPPVDVTSGNMMMQQVGGNGGTMMNNAPVNDRTLGADRPMQGTCKINGKVVPCEQITNGVKTGFKIIGWILLIGLLGFIFWVWMLIHAFTHPIPNKVVWIICFFVFGLLTAILYYFMVKRSFVPAVAPMPEQMPPTPPQTPPLV